MTPDEEAILAKNIATIKEGISFHLKGAKHSFIITLILILGAFVTYNIGVFLLSYILVFLSGISICLSYRFIAKWDFLRHVLMGIEKSDLGFFINNNK